MIEVNGVIGKLLGKQLTLGELMNIDPGRQQRSNDSIVKLVKVYHELKKESILDKFKYIFTGKTSLLMYYIIMKFEVTSKSGNIYEVFVRLSPDFDLSNWKNNRIKIYCSCLDFKYRSAYLLDKNNSLFSNDRIKISLGEAITQAPKFKTKTTTLCKHSYAVINWIISNYSSIMMSI